jgi:hypothetical protein
MLCQFTLQHAGFNLVIIDDTRDPTDNRIHLLLAATGSVATIKIANIISALSPHVHKVIDSFYAREGTEGRHGGLLSGLAA